MNLAEFLAARLDEDEATAKAATPAPWVVDDYDSKTIYVDAHEQYVVPIWDMRPEDQRPEDAAHIARHDPARVLRDVEAKRKILAIHQPHLSDYGEPPTCSACWPEPKIGTHPLYPCSTVRALAAVWSDHPDYRQEWALA